MTILVTSSCVSYVPPSSLHQDMLPNQHPIITDSLQDKAQLIYANAYRFRARYIHNALPDFDRNRGIGMTMGYGYAERKQSLGVSLGYGLGKMINNTDRKYDYQHLIVRSSYGIDFHEGRWHGSMIKLQGACSKGYGTYQGQLAEYYPRRNEYDLAIPDGDWLWSYGYGMDIHYIPSEAHDIGFGFYYNRSTDFDKEGFRADYFTVDLGYRYSQRYRLKAGGMFDARLTLRGLGFFLGLGYDLPF